MKNSKFDKLFNMIMEQLENTENIMIYQNFKRWENQYGGKIIQIPQTGLITIPKQLLISAKINITKPIYSDDDFQTDVAQASMNEEMYQYSNEQSSIWTSCTGDVIRLSNNNSNGVKKQLFDQTNNLVININRINENNSKYIFIEPNPQLKELNIWLMSI